VKLVRSFQAGTRHRGAKKNQSPLAGVGSGQIRSGALSRWQRFGLRRLAAPERLVATTQAGARDKIKQAHPNRPSVPGSGTDTVTAALGEFTKSVNR
jgi:hypothetical protein